MKAQQILDQLTEAYAQLDLLKIDHAQKRDDAIPSEVEAMLADIDTEFEPKLDAVNELISNLEEQAKKAVLEAGESVKGGALQAVYAKGRVSWDTKKLDGLMIVLVQKVRHETTYVRSYGTKKSLRTTDR